MNILICDDEQSVCDSLQHIPVMQNHRITAVHDGEEALLAFKNDSYDVVFLDVLIPGEDGFEILKKLLSHNTTAHIVMMTGFIVNEKEAADLGVFDYLYKPFDIDRVSQIVDRVEQLQTQ